jgi:hypothetical protein
VEVGGEKAVRDLMLCQQTCHFKFVLSVPPWCPMWLEKRDKIPLSIIKNCPNFHFIFNQ